MSEPLPPAADEARLAERIEALLAAGEEPAAREGGPTGPWRAHQRIDLLLRSHLAPPDPGRAFAAVQAALSPQRRLRIAKRITQRLKRHPPGRRRTGSWWTAAAAAALLLAAAGAGWRLLPQPVPSAQPATEFARLSSVGQGLELRRGGRPLPIGDGRLVPGDQLAGAAAGSEVVFADGSRLTLDAATSAVLDRAGDGAKRIDLRSGGLQASVAHQPAGAPLRIATPFAEATVVGTVFSLSVDAARARLAVDEGLVRFARAGAGVDVAAGRAAAATAADPPALVPAIAGHEPARLLDEGDDAGPWRLDPGNQPIGIATTSQEPFSGASCLRLTYGRDPTLKMPCGYRLRAFAIRPGDRAIRLALRVEAAAAQARFIVRVQEADHDIWSLLEEPIAADGGWRVLTVPIPTAEHPPKLIDGYGDRAWRPDQVRDLLIGATLGSATVCVDALTVMEER